MRTPFLATTLLLLSTASPVALTTSATAQDLPARDPITCEDWGSYDFFAWASADTVASCLRAGADPVAPLDESGGTPLHHAARATPDPAVIAVLVQAGADPNAPDLNGGTPCTRPRAQTRTPASLPLCWRLVPTSTRPIPAATRLCTAPGATPAPACPGSRLGSTRLRSRNCCGRGPILSRATTTAWSPIRPTASSGTRRSSPGRPTSRSTPPAWSRAPISVPRTTTATLSSTTRPPTRTQPSPRCCWESAPAPGR